MAGLFLIGTQKIVIAVKTGLFRNGFQIQVRMAD